MRLGSTVAIALTVVATTLGACDKARDVAPSSTANSCATCHGYPPEKVTSTGLPHPADADCVLCHATTVDANNAILPGGAHMNGRVDGGHQASFVGVHTTFALAEMSACAMCHGADFGGGSAPSCNSCHAAPNGADFAGDWRTNCTFCHGGGSAGRDPGWSGDLAEAAPPQTVAGPAVEDQTNANPKVGAHQRHVVAGTYSAPLACDSCHVVPPQTFPQSLQHIDGTAELTFGPLARQGVTSPGYANGTCAVYCHGATSLLTAGSDTAPVWTSTGTVTCGTCHTLTPTSGGLYGHQFHVTDQNVACEKCHAGYSIAGNTVNLTTHVNGTFEAAIVAGPFTRSATLGPDATPTWPSGSCTTTCHTSIPPF